MILVLFYNKNLNGFIRKVSLASQAAWLSFKRNNWDFLMKNQTN